MQYRKLGRTGLDVGVIGLGTEHLWHEPKETVISVIDEAIGNGVNYMDLFMPSPEIRDNIGAAISGRREKVMIAGHIGSVEKEGQYLKTREKAICEEYVNDLLSRLKTDYIDFLMLHFIDGEDDFQSVFGEEGMLELALRLKKQGKARYIGMSSHKVPVSLMAVNSGHLDVLMFPVNPAFDMLPGDTELGDLWEAKPYKQLEDNGSKPESTRRDLYLACEKQGTAIVAMKPYAAGWLFYKENPSSIVLTPAQCLHYSLAQPGVCTVVPGCKTVEQMREALAYLDASDEEKDFSRTISSTKWDIKGSCMYCNHCLPCPVGIDIGATTRLADSAGKGITDLIKLKYEQLAVKASECLKCGSCMERCPFGVDVISNMERADSIFG